MTKKLKATLGNGLLWAVVWALWGVFMTVIGHLFGFDLVAGPREALPRIALEGWIMGFLGGAAFSGVLGLLHRSKTVSELSAARLGLWGALAGLIAPEAALFLALEMTGFSMTPEMFVQSVLLFGLPGAVTAFGMIKLAQRAR